jgi:hypothetical protein
MKTFKYSEDKSSTNLFKTKLLIVAGTLFAGSLFAASTTANADEVTYTVQAGDTLSQISDKFYHDQEHIQALANANDIQDARFIYVGQEIKVNTDDKTNTATQKDVASKSKETVAPATAETVYTTNNGFTAHSAKEAIAMTESGGSYTAQNGQYYGRYQLTSSYLGGDFSPENQERVADAYVAERYGSWEAAWTFHLANGWY